jgi:hypothetical protein
VNQSSNDLGGLRRAVPQIDVQLQRRLASSSRLRRVAAATLVPAALAVLASACGTTAKPVGTSAASAAQRSTVTGHGAAQTIKSLGAVPIPKAQSSAPQPASPGHLALVVMGDPVQVTLPGVVTTLTALGPDFNLPPLTGAPPAQASGTMTVQIRADQGSVTLQASDFRAYDQNQKLVPLAASTQSLTVAAGQTASLSFSGTFVAGNAQLTWVTQGQPVAIWDFVADYD